MWKKGWHYQAWMNTLELGDGTDLVITFTSKTLPASYHEPGEYEQSEPEFYLDGVLTEREELPEQITAEVIAELIHSAREDKDYDFGGPVEFD